MREVNDLNYIYQQLCVPGIQDTLDLSQLHKLDNDLDNMSILVRWIIRTVEGAI